MVATARLLGCASLALLLLASPARSEAEATASDATSRLVEQALSRRLFEARKWRVLLHYREATLRPGFRSRAVTPGFFLAATGREDPRAELIATVRAVFDPASTDARCSFPERAAWLSEQLEAPLPGGTCPELEAWLEQMAPGALTVIFPEAFINNPASMFGHTFLRVDRSDADRGQDLIAYAINFAAETGDDGGAAFAVKGIVGGYPGFFSVLPYYEKIKQYGDFENRDIWEYPLALDREETLAVLRHLWELREIEFDYYFFDDNCSYQLLALLAVARPEFALDEPLRVWVVPIDTVRSLIDQIGLRGEPVYRPSPATLLRAEARLADRRTAGLARSIADGALSPDAPEVAALSDEERALALSLAYDVLRHRLMSQKVERDETVTLARRILIARSRIPGARAQTETEAAPRRPRISPDHGHQEKRLFSGGGVRGGRGFVDLALRPGFHTQIDPSGGYPVGATIQYLEPTLRFFPDLSRLRLHAFDLVRIRSLAARDRFFPSVSWQVQTGLETRLLPTGGAGSLEPEPVWAGSVGAGLAYAWGANAIFYGFATARIEAGPELEDHVALAPEVQVGVELGPRESRWRGILEGTLFPYVVGDDTLRYRVGLEQRLTLTQSLAVMSDVALEGSYGERRLYVRAGLAIYF